MGRRRANLDLNPSLAELFDGLRSDYIATKTDALNRQRTGLAPMGASADWHIRFEFQYLHFMELARDVDRNDLVVGQAINRLVTNVVQEGFPVDPQTGDTDVDKLLLDSWAEWGEEKRSCHFGQVCSWKDIQRLTLRQTFVDGDMFNVLTNQGSIDTIEGHRCRRPTNTTRNVVFGILKNDAGQPLEAWLTKENIQPMQQLNLVSGIQPYPFYDKNGNAQVLHGVMRRRFSMTRGVTVLAPTFKAAGLHDDIQFAELVKRQVQSCIAFMRELPLSDLTQQPPGTMGEVELRPNENTVRLLQQIYPGMEVTGNPGEKLQAFSPNVAGSDFISHSMLVLAFIAVNLDLPLQVMMLDPTQTNFSGWRGAIDQARLRWREMQQWLIENLHRPVYRWKVREWLRENSPRGERLRAAAAKGLNVFSHLWHPPGWSYIEPLKDAQADALRGVSLLSSPRRILGENQLDWNRIVTETIEDHDFKIRAAIAAAKKIQADLGVEVDWHELIGAALPQGVTLSLTAQGEDKPQPGDTGKSGTGKKSAA